MKMCVIHVEGDSMMCGRVTFMKDSNELCVACSAGCSSCVLAPRLSAASLCNLSFCLAVASPSLTSSVRACPCACAARSHVSPARSVGRAAPPTSSTVSRPALIVRHSCVCLRRIVLGIEARTVAVDSARR